MAPNTSGAHTHTTSPKQWNIGSIDKKLSSSPMSGKIILAWEIIELILPLVSTIFLGLPVVPPLWRYNAASTLPPLSRISLL